MNLTALLLTTALATGGDPCGAPCAPAPSCGCDSPGFFVKLKAKFAKSHDDCGCTPACGTPLFAGFTTACHEPKDPCGKPGLLTRLKAKFQKGNDCCAPPCTTGCGTAAPSGCALPVAPTPTPGVPLDTPKVMPKSDTIPNPTPKKLETSVPLNIPTVR